MGGAAGELYRHPGGLATRVYVDGLAVTSRRCCAVLDAAPAGRPCPRQGCVFIAISSRNPLLGGLYGATACIITAHFAAFTYIEPLLINLQESRRPPSPACCCCQGFPGCWVTLSRVLIDRHLKGLIFAALLLSGGALAPLAPPVLRHCRSVLAGYC